MGFLETNPRGRNGGESRLSTEQEIQTGHVQRRPGDCCAMLPDNIAHVCRLVVKAAFVNHYSNTGSNHRGIEKNLVG